MKKTILVLAFLMLIACRQKNSQPSYKGFGQGSLSAEILEEFAPPPLPTQRLTRIQKMLDVRAMTAGVFNSQSKKLYTHWSITGTYQVWKLKKPLGFPVQMTAGEDPSRLVGLAPNGQYLVVSRDRGGDEMRGLYLQDANGGALELIYRKENVQAFLEYISDDSDFLIFRANDKDPSSYAFYRYDIKTKEITEIFDGQPAGYWQMADYWNEEKFLLARWLGNTRSEYYLYDEKSKKLESVLGQEESVEYGARFGRSANELIVLTNKLGEFRRLYTYELSKKELTPVTDETNFNIESFTIDRSRSKLFYQVNQAGYFKPNAMRFKDFKPLSFPKIPGDPLQVYYGWPSTDGRFLSIKAVYTDSPGKTFVYDWQTKKLTQWTRPSVPEVNVAEIPEPKLEFYPTRDGEKIPMFVQRPQACVDKVCPVVVDFHGGPEGQSYPWFVATRQLFLEQGFVYVEPNVRGSDGYGKTWLNSDNGKKRLDVITDIEDAAIYIKKQWAVGGEAPKVAALGGSYGGYSVFMAMTRFAGAYDAGVAIVGMSNLVTFLENTAPYRRKLRESEYGYLDKDREVLKELSPVTYIEKLQNPILIVHGVNDPRVPAGEAVQIYRTMQEKGVEGNLILFADEGHGIRKRKNKAIYFGHILKFLNQHLKSSQ